MKKLFIFLSVALHMNAQAQEKVLTVLEKQQLIAEHKRAFQALNERVRDPFILKGPDNMYYLTGTTGGSHWGDTVGIKLWRSKDLAEWESLGFVWTLYGDGKTADSWHFKQKIRQPDFKNPYAIWAPEVHYMNGTWWLTHCMNVGGHSLLKSKSGKPDGPYEVMDPIEKSRIDNHLFKDDDGTVYYCWQADIIAKMNPEMTRIVEEPVQLKHDGKHPLGYEGILIMKFNDIYVHIASGRYGYETTNTYDLYYATSKNLYGPYGKRKMMIKNAGHGNLFQDKKGNWWSTAFDHEFYNEETMDKWSLWLVPIDIKVKTNDVKFVVKDKRFKPNCKDQKTVRKLSKTGIPEAWKGKAPWYIPED